MKKLLVIAALSTVIAAPSFAQRGPNDPNLHQRPRPRAAQQRSTTPPGGIYYEGDDNLNPDFQLGGRDTRRRPRRRDLGAAAGPVGRGTPWAGKERRKFAKGTGRGSENN
jgi:hypothetical protein